MSLHSVILIQDDCVVVGLRVGDRVVFGVDCGLEEDVGVSVGDSFGSDDAHGLHAYLPVSVTP